MSSFSSNLSFFKLSIVYIYEMLFIAQYMFLYYPKFSGESIINNIED